MMVDFIGISGVMIVVTAYALLQFEKIDPKLFIYSFMNTIGSMMILFSLIYNWNLASFLIELFWILISIYGLWRWWKRDISS